VFFSILTSTVFPTKALVVHGPGRAPGSTSSLIHLLILALYTGWCKNTSRTFTWHYATE